MKFALTLPNRGVLMGITTPEQMLQMAETAEGSGLFSDVWVGDSLLGKPRMESVTLMAGIAARTTRVRIAPACMASFPLRDPVLLAYQWASLDLLAEGRTLLIACTGIVPQVGGAVEAAHYGLDNKARVERLVEWITILKRLWTEDDVHFEGKHYRLQGITIEPKPAAKPRPPIWIANNAEGPRERIERTHRRVARHADGWQTSLYDPDDVRWRLRDVREKAREIGRNPDELETSLYHNININENREAALVESKRFLDTYYTEDFSSEMVAGWTAAGSPAECVEHLMVYARMGIDTIGLRCTGWDQMGQLRRVIEEVLPYVSPAAGTIQRLAGY
jgi:alkanesulfonate monooxygenase SsuD/methylene tetrahydromethanopterin reductase-like flavin-dependent oxidoreductase (luciferase family)